jgi:hypothetical protein
MDQQRPVLRRLASPWHTLDPDILKVFAPFDGFMTVLLRSVWRSLACDPAYLSQYPRLHLHPLCTLHAWDGALFEHNDAFLYFNPGLFPCLSEPCWHHSFRHISLSIVPPTFWPFGLCPQYYYERMRFATYSKHVGTWHTFFFFASIYPNSDVGFVEWGGGGSCHSILARCRCLHKKSCVSRGYDASAVASRK